MPLDCDPNAYSQRWFESFHIGISDTRTAAEVEFICSFAPLPQFRRVADICCGMGRHARALAERGYSVTGVDRDAAMIARARQLGGGPRYFEADLRHYQPEIAMHDAVIVMSQSFGHFDAETNRAVLQRLTGGVRNFGRLILDVWNPDFFHAHQAHRDFQLGQEVVHETKHVRDNRLFVHLSYAGGDQERFEWQLFTPSDMESLVGSLGLAVIACCTDFESSMPPCAAKPRLQFVLERGG